MHTCPTRFQSAVLLLVGLLSFSSLVVHAATATVAAGQAVTLSITANGSAPFSYQWFKDSAILTGSTSPTFAISNFQTTNAGVYYAVVSNSAGSTTSDSATVTLASTAAPVITTQPLSQTLPTGANATFTVVATGSAPLTYQWQQNGVNFPYPNATVNTASFTNPNLGSLDAGTYTCIVSNSAGSVASAGAVLTVTAAATAPVITTQPSSQTVTAGTNVTFIAAASGTPAPTYQWKLNGVNISGATSASLTLASVQASAAGTYTVVATNSAGSATSAGAVLMVNPVTVAPVITTQPLSQTVATGNSVTFTAAASGVPTPTYQWKKAGTSISGANGTSYTIASAAASDASTFTVVATNSAGSATSSGAVLMINSAPVITTQPATQTVTKGSSVTFKVAVSGAPTLTYQWRKNGYRIRYATGASYTIASVGSNAAATYTVVVSNSYGSITSRGAVLAVKTSTSPTVIRVDFNGDGKSDILWQDGVTGECCVWLMAGTSKSSVVSLGTFSTDWQPDGTGDFNGDGKSDILWQNNQTGERNIWLMNGTTVTSVVSLGTVSTDWQMAGTGDFNGDGKSDILWQNNQTGERTVWLMNGTAVTSVVSLGTISTDWQISGAGDFNKDGQSDILLQNIVTGECSVWLMAGTSVGSVVSLGVQPLEWQVSGTGDFNKDGQSDILLQDVLTGECRVWLMAGTKVSSVVSLGIVPAEWVIRN